MRNILERRGGTGCSMSHCSANLSILIILPHSLDPGTSNLHYTDSTLFNSCVSLQLLQRWLRDLITSSRMPARNRTGLVVSSSANFFVWVRENLCNCRFQVAIILPYNMLIGLMSYDKLFDNLWRLRTPQGLRNYHQDCRAVDFYHDLAIGISTPVSSRLWYEDEEACRRMWAGG